MDNARFFRIETKINDLINNYNNCQSFKKNAKIIINMMLQKVYKYILLQKNYTNFSTKIFGNF